MIEKIARWAIVALFLMILTPTVLALQNPDLSPLYPGQNPPYAPWTLNWVGQYSTMYWQQNYETAQGVVVALANSASTSDNFANAYLNQNWLWPPTENTGWNQATSGPGFSGTLYTYLNVKWTSYSPNSGNAWFHFGWDFQLWFHGANVGPCNGHYMEFMLHFVAGSNDILGQHRDPLNTLSQHCLSGGGGYYVSDVIAQIGDNSWYNVWPKDLTYFFQLALAGPSGSWNLSQYGVWYITGGMFGVELGGGSAVGVMDYVDFRDSLYGSGGGCSPYRLYVC